MACTKNPALPLNKSEMYKYQTIWKMCIDHVRNEENELVFKRSKIQLGNAKEKITEDFVYQGRDLDFWSYVRESYSSFFGLGIFVERFSRRF